MPIPKYDEIMLPLLKALADGQSHTKRELTEKMADHFALTAQERQQMLPSTRSTYIKHRTGWAAFGLRKAGLATNPVEGTLVITDEGRKFLSTNPTGRLTPPVLRQFETFRQFEAEMKQRSGASPSKVTRPSPASTAEDDETTPEERIVKWISDRAIDGVRPLSSAHDLADEYLIDRGYRTNEARVRALISWETTKNFTSGFVAGLGGVLTSGGGRGQI